MDDKKTTSESTIDSGIEEKQPAEEVRDSEASATQDSADEELKGNMANEETDEVRAEVDASGEETENTRKGSAAAETEANPEDADDVPEKADAKANAEGLSEEKAQAEKEDEGVDVGTPVDCAEVIDAETPQKANEDGKKEDAAAAAVEEREVKETDDAAATAEDKSEVAAPAAEAPPEEKRDGAAVVPGDEKITLGGLMSAEKNTESTLANEAAPAPAESDNAGKVDANAGDNNNDDDDAVDEIADKDGEKKKSVEGAMDDDTPTKPSPRSNNSILSKLRRSITKVKKAFASRSPSSKDLQPPTSKASER